MENNIIEYLCSLLVENNIIGTMNKPQGKINVLFKCFHKKHKIKIMCMYIFTKVN